jgi:hypothetical protein
VRLKEPGRRAPLGQLRKRHVLRLCDRPPGGYDHHATFDEVFFPGGIDRKFVVGAWIFQGPISGSISFKDRVESGDMDWYPNPRYDPDS